MIPVRREHRNVRRAPRPVAGIATTGRRRHCHHHGALDEEGGRWHLRAAAGRDSRCPRKPVPSPSSLSFTRSAARRRTTLFHSWSATPKRHPSGRWLEVVGVLIAVAVAYGMYKGCRPDVTWRNSSVHRHLPLIVVAAGICPTASGALRDRRVAARPGAQAFDITSLVQLVVLVRRSHQGHLQRPRRLRLQFAGWLTTSSSCSSSSCAPASSARTSDPLHPNPPRKVKVNYVNRSVPAHRCFGRPDHRRHPGGLHRQRLRDNHQRHQRRQGPAGADGDGHRRTTCDCRRERHRRQHQNHQQRQQGHRFYVCSEGADG